jgi:hypothetical protein
MVLFSELVPRLHFEYRDLHGYLDAWAANLSDNNDHYSGLDGQGLSPYAVIALSINNARYYE